ncbi:inorganic pyrophosphatase [Streptococcus suis]|nr:inorganic pyrophosphatase [Streptococcus suis]
MDKIYQIIIDRPIGYIDKFGNQYPINYGYVPNLLAGDGEEQDVYIISKAVRQPLTANWSRLSIAEMMSRISGS